MRILQFCNYADRIGGAEVYAHSLLEGLGARGHEVALFGASSESEIDRPGLRVIQRPVYDRARLVQDPPARNALREFVQRFRPDVIHVHNLFSVALEVIHELGQCGVPVFHTIHDFQLLCPNSWCVRGDGSACPGGAGEQCFLHGCERNYPYDSWAVLLAAIRQRLAARLARIAVAPSAYLLERLRAHGWVRVEHLPYFVDFLPMPPGTPRADRELLYVGRLEREKGVDTLVAALAEIRSVVPDTRLTLVGRGTLEAALRKQVSDLGLASAVRILTNVPRDEIAAHYANASLCVLPSVWAENSPLVAYECLVSGLPMAGSRVGGIPELIGEDAGVTFRPGDPADLARSVLGFLRLSLAERERMSEAARRRSRAFQKPQHLDTLEGYYAELGAQPTLPRSPDESWIELLPVLHRVGVELSTPRPSPPPLEIVRALARTLGLPKVFRD